MTIILIAIATFISTLIGGLVALRFKDRLHLILGFSAGAILGVSFFDLIPESIKLGSNFYDVQMITAITALGFFAYLVLDRIVFLHFHAHNDDEIAHDHEHSESRGILGAVSLSLHSFFDGIAIGLAFQVSSSIGFVVAIAVLVHDFSDGINTVNMILKNRGEGRIAFRWLIVDAVAPILGVASTLLFTLSGQILAIILALFSGFFLYIGASDLIPESHHAHPKFLTTAMTILGASILYIVIRLSSI